MTTPIASTTKSLAPIALFAYKRLDHLQATIESLKINVGADASDLYVFSDGARDEASLEAVLAVRSYLRTVTGFRSLSIIERSRNWGLADSIIDGVTMLCEKAGSVIVLEDDIVTGRGFLHFMNSALSIYRDTESVMHISGYSYPIKCSQLNYQNSYFLRVPVCWGWATWQRAWRHYKRDLQLGESFSSRMKSEIDFQGAFNYWKQYERNRSGHLKTWFIFWYMTVFKNNGLSLFPAKSLTQNIGHDGSGEHCSNNDNYTTTASDLIVNLELNSPVEQLEIIKAHRAYFLKIRGSIFVKILRKLGLHS